MINITWSELLPFGQAIGWMLIHSLWQIALIGLTLRLSLLLLPAKQPNARYAALLGGLVLVVLCAGYTLYQEWPSGVAKHASTQGVTSEATAIPSPELPIEASSYAAPSGSVLPITDQLAALLQQFGQYLQPYLPLLAIIWYVGVLLLSMTMMLGFSSSTDGELRMFL